MKKIISVLLTTLVLLTFSACTNRNQQQQGGRNQQGQNKQEQNIKQGNVTYKDGTYVGAGDKWQYGAEDATVVVRDGKITEVTLRRLDTAGKEVNYDNWTGKEVNGKVYPNLKQARIDVANRMVEKQTYDVDSVAGATVSSENWKIAVKRALEKAAAQ